MGAAYGRSDGRCKKKEITFPARLDIPRDKRRLIRLERAALMSRAGYALRSCLQSFT